MDDGYQTLISFSTAPTVGFWEKSITPPGMDGGDAIETTTMHNDDLRTFAPRALVTLTEFTMMAAYNPAVYDNVMALLNVNTTITVFFPNLDTLAFFGFLRTFEPAELVEGTQPEATITVTPSNLDPVSGAEEFPVYTAYVPPPSPFFEEEEEQANQPTSQRGQRDVQGAAQGQEEQAGIPGAQLKGRGAYARPGALERQRQVQETHQHEAEVAQQTKPQDHEHQTTQ
jgi:hypothetical protein